MPIYEYRCPKCGDFDIMQKITEGPLRKCPTCKAKVTKLMSSTAFQLKGSGWYITDYGRGGNKGGGAEAGKTETSASSDSGSGSTEKSSTGTDTSSSEKKPAKGKAKSGGESSAAA